ncbi:uncharacterized protein BO97DRAFT_115405 [Aspergillus homomorphus CBS 101889]|uniref:Zn(2)-C6 fungal-type domain-containing protein n=1 Tax=Aspergillus homomorphus (strain CBS 101889) TaxID=1450537 RepID=A0A395HTP9_ASPHC|nr:hypothetical protein BO97DRAFT_115405 [Aspergillus homomorphus CBS 101889]RAL10879.1 hypothetical protein BO97DRAFT_115405 [Aspergillus homomorphus CBS 101889]
MSHVQSSRVVKPSSPTPRHRQNTSCDPCRRLKRRCVLPPHTNDGDGRVGTSCNRLGHRCTFDFVKSVSARLRKSKDHPVGVLQPTQPHKQQHHHHQPPSPCNNIRSHHIHHGDVVTECRSESGFGT